MPHPAPSRPLSPPPRPLPPSPVVLRSPSPPAQSPAPPPLIVNRVVFLTDPTPLEDKDKKDIAQVRQPGIVVSHFATHTGCERNAFAAQARGRENHCSRLWQS